MRTRESLFFAWTTALAAGLTTAASGATSDSFYANIRSVSYGGGAFVVSADAAVPNGRTGEHE